jgi:ferrous iron transport protein B
MDTAKFDKQKNSAAVNLIESLKDTPVYIDRFKAEGFENMIASLNDLKAKGEKKSSFEKSVEEKYNTYLESIAETEARQRGMQLKQSAAGRIGFFLEPVSKLAGFDWKDNIALIGGFAAKEIIVSTMSMTYTIENRDVSLSEAGAANSPETETKENSGIVNILKSSPGWSMLRAFSLMIFVMLYAPCIVTVAVIWRESGSWKWALFSTAYSTAIAFALAVSVYQIGGALGIGVN